VNQKYQFNTQQTESKHIFSYEVKVELLESAQAGLEISYFKLQLLKFKNAQR